MPMNGSSATRRALGIAVAALGGVLFERRGRRRAELRAAAAIAAAERAHAEYARDRERLERQVKRLERERTQQLELIQRVRQSWQAEREWNRELRGQVQRLGSEHGMFGDGEDARALVLRAAIERVEAGKGVLVSRHDADGDGSLDVVLARGFEHDPADSAVVQRFA